MDLEKNELHIDNDNDIYHTEEINILQQGKEVFHIDHESYFVERAYHEFYDEPEYEEPVRTKVFDFLYRLASANSPESIGKRAIARESGIQMRYGNKSFTVSRGNNLKYNVIDLNGRTAMSGNVSAGQSVDLNALKNGVYVLRVQGEQAIRFGISK